MAAAAAGYTVAALSAAPGSFDGLAPPAPYNWTSPPPDFAGDNRPPSSGHASIRVVNGASLAATAVTNDGQAQVRFEGGAFTAEPGTPAVAVDVKPVSGFPAAGRLSFLTNAYLVLASAPLAGDAIVTLTYSYRVGIPSALYGADPESREWRALRPSLAVEPYTVAATTRSLGYFAAGHPKDSDMRAPQRAGPSLPLLVAVLVGLVLLAGVPLVILAKKPEAGEAGDR